MYSYPYTEEGLSQALKEICNSDSKVNPESFSMISSHGKLGGEVEKTYEFKTEDGCKYELTAKGEQIVEPFRVDSQMYQITEIKKI